MYALSQYAHGQFPTDALKAKIVGNDGTLKHAETLLLT